jgi:hypothetical protein
MPLDKNLLGTELFNKVDLYNNKNIDEIGDIQQARLNFWKAVAEVIVDHIKTNALLNVPGTGLAAPNGPVTGASITGKIL